MRATCFGRAPVGDEQGFTLVELVAALMIIAIVATGFMASIGIGFRTLAVARQRQTAAEIASARLERLRNVPYDQLFLDVQPTHSTDPNDPDYYVDASGTTYDVSGSGQNETLIVDPNPSDAVDGVLHFEDPVTVGSTTMKVYQYVTWVSDATAGGSQAYKRVTVVVQYHTPAATGVNRMVRASSLYTPDSVTLVPSSTTSTTAAATTTTAPTTTTTVPAGPCPGDVTGPTGSFTIGVAGSAQAGYTASTSITLNLSFTDSCTPIVANFSNDNVTWGADVTYNAASPQVSWTVTTGDGLKTVYGKVRDGATNSTVLVPQTVTLDATLPTTPGNFNRTASCSGSNRTVKLTWTASTDTNFVGYRVYRSTDGVTWQVLGTTTNLSYSDTHSKTLNSVRFYVVGYDKAGNESNATATISLAKNQCS